MTTTTQKYDDIKFAQIAYDKTNSIVFDEHHVVSVPEVRVFMSGTDSNARFWSLEYDEMSVELMERWLERVINPAKFRKVNSVA